MGDGAERKKVGQKKTKRASHRAVQGEKRQRTNPSNKMLRLITGANMPVVQLGTYRMKGSACTAACRAALSANGYTGLDTASIYSNEGDIGSFLASDSCPPRSSIFLQTKLWRSHQGSAKVVARAMRQSLRKLGVDYVDLWLLHWPGPGRHLNRPPVRKAKPVWSSAGRTPIAGNDSVMVPKEWSPAMRLDTWRHMCALTGPSAGARAAGVCNFSARQLVELLAFCEAEGLAKPAVVQNECHPLLPATAVREVCQAHGIVFQAYASLGSGLLDLSTYPAVRAAAAAHGKTPAQVLLRWAVQLGCAVVPKSSDAGRQQENFDLWDFELSPTEMDGLGALTQQKEGQNTMPAVLYGDSCAD